MVCRANCAHACTCTIEGICPLTGLIYLAINLITAYGQELTCHPKLFLFFISTPLCFPVISIHLSVKSFTMAGSSENAVK